VNAYDVLKEHHVVIKGLDRKGPPPPVRITDAELEELGNKMAARIEQYRGSALHRLRTKGRAALVRALGRLVDVGVRRGSPRPTAEDVSYHVSTRRPRNPPASSRRWASAARSAGSVSATRRVNAPFSARSRNVLSTSVRVVCSMTDTTCHLMDRSLEPTCWRADVIAPPSRIAGTMASV
jgi:hypothetical protein